MDNETKALVEKFMDDHDVEFKMIALIDGEEQVCFRGSSFDDVADYAALADQAFEKYVLESTEHSLDSITDDIVNLKIDERSY